MSINKFQIPYLLRATSDIVYPTSMTTALNNLINSKNQIEYDNALKNVAEAVIECDQPLAYSKYFNTPIYHPLTLKSDGLELLFEAAYISITNQRTIVKTELQGKDGTVKEFISNGDYQISVSGVFATNSFKYPMDDVQNFTQMMRKKNSLVVIHPVLNSLNITSVAVEGFSLPESKLNVQPYSFSMISDFTKEEEMTQ